MSDEPLTSPELRWRESVLRHELIDIPPATDAIVETAKASSWECLRRPENNTWGVDILEIRLCNRIAALTAELAAERDWITKARWALKELGEHLIESGLRNQRLTNELEAERANHQDTYGVLLRERERADKAEAELTYIIEGV